MRFKPVFTCRCAIAAACWFAAPQLLSAESWLNATTNAVARPIEIAGVHNGFRDFSRLKASQKAAWKTRPDQADISPPREAALLWEQFREMARTPDTAKRPEDYRSKLADAEHAADALCELLRESSDNVAIDTAFKQATQSCAACHKKYRNE